MTPVDLDPEIVTDLPPSSLLAYVVLRDVDEPLRTRDVARYTAMSERTTRRGLQLLAETEVAIERQATDGDARGREYVLRNGK